MAWFNSYRVLSFRNDTRAASKGKLGKRIVRKSVYKKVGKWLR